MSAPLISVFMPVYNHGPYVEQAIAGVMSQKTQYPFELIICDDFSTDGSREIIDRLAAEHPNIVKSYQPHNTKGVRNMMQGLSLVRGKYVAMCEGDDYWTDPGKLQTQASFLEANPDFTVSTHKVEMVYTDAPCDHEYPRYIYKNCLSDDQRVRDGIFYADEVVDNYYMHTSSMVFRWKFREGLPEYFRMRMLLDHFLLLIHAADGKIKYFDKPMSAWRRHIDGYSYAQLHDKGLFFQKEGNDWLKCYREMDRYFHGRFKYQIRERMLLALRALTDHCMSTGQYEELKRIYEQHWDLVQKPVLENAIITQALQKLYPEKRELFPAWANAVSQNAGIITIPLKPELNLDILSDSENSLWSRWTANGDYSAFASTWGAITAYCYYYGINIIWLPAVCPSYVVETLSQLQYTRRYYPVDAALRIREDFLSIANYNELIVTFDRFGEGVPESLARSLEHRHWIDLRNSPSFSSRAKTTVFDLSYFGAPDGALMIGEGVDRIRPGIATPSATQIPDGFLEGRERELERPLAAGPASKLSLDIIKRTPFDNVVEGRERSFASLMARLKSFAWDTLLSNPWTFPIRIPPGTLTAALIANLVRKGIDARQIWLPEDTKVDCFASHVMGSLAMIPCHHALTGTQIDHLVASVESAFENQNNELKASGRSRQ